jgi:hypothetical protein
MSEVTIAIQIGNSDDKLTQKEWASFVAQSDLIIKDYATIVHFSGAPSNWEWYQNYAWIFNCEESNQAGIKKALILIRKHYKQDSIAWSECKTEFI